MRCTCSLMSWPPAFIRGVRMVFLNGFAFPRVCGVQMPVAFSTSAVPSAVTSLPAARRIRRFAVFARWQNFHISPALNPFALRRYGGPCRSGGDFSQHPQPDSRGGSQRRRFCCQHPQSMEFRNARGDHELRLEQHRCDDQQLAVTARQAGAFSIHLAAKPTTVRAPCVTSCCVRSQTLCVTTVRGAA
jgi:hypothetical protein